MESDGLVLHVEEELRVEVGEQFRLLLNMICRVPLPGDRALHITSRQYPKEVWIILGCQGGQDFKTLADTC